MADKVGRKPVDPTPIKSSLREWSVPVVKGEHHDMPTSCKFQDWLMCRINEAVSQTKIKIPAISNVSDFIRTACYRQLQQLEPVLSDNKYSNRMHKEELMMELARDEWEEERFEDHLLKIEQRVASMQKRGAIEEIPRMLRKAFKLAMEIDDSYWQKRWESTFRDKFGEYMKLDKISTAPKDAEEDE
jgi:hypothetical protein